MVAVTSLERRLEEELLEKRLLDEIVTPDVFTAAHTLRNRNSFTRADDATQKQLRRSPTPASSTGSACGSGAMFRDSSTENLLTVNSNDHR